MTILNIFYSNTALQSLMSHCFGSLAAHIVIEGDGSHTILGCKLRQAKTKKVVIKRAELVFLLCSIKVTGDTNPKQKAVTILKCRFTSVNFSIKFESPNKYQM